MPNPAQTSAALSVNKMTGAIEAPVSAATFKSANSLGGGVPEAHAASHASAGADPVTLAQSQVTGLTAALAAKADDSATTTALALKAPLASPTFTGAPAAPTAAQGTNTTQLASTAFVRAEVAALVASAPGTLDTLDELAAALGDDPNLATTLTTAIGLKADASALTSHTGNTSNPHSVTKSQVGLANAENTSDANKPVSTATQTALDAKAPLASPALTGNPTAPTQSTSDDSTKIATTAFVHDAIAEIPPGGGGGTKTLCRWDAIEGQPPSSGSNFATYVTRNGRQLMEFSDGADESLVFKDKIPEGADLSSGIRRIEVWITKTATSGNMVSAGAFERGNTNYGSDSFATAKNSAATAVPGSSGDPLVLTTDHSSSEIDGLTAGDIVRVTITNLAADGSHTVGSEMQLDYVELQQIA